MTDLMINEDGDLMIAPNGDLLTVSGDEQIIQAIIFRLKTYRGDYTLSPNLGFSLEDFIGKPNSAATRSLIETTIEDILSVDFLVINPTIKCIPLNEEEVFILIEFPAQSDSTKKVQISSSLDLKAGSVFPRFNYHIE
jgi:hypothetical protein